MFSYKFIVRGVKHSLKMRHFMGRKMTEISVPGIFVGEEDLVDALSKNPRSANVRLAKMLKAWDSQVSGIKLRLIEDRGEATLSISGIRDLIREELFGEEREDPVDALNWERYYARYVESKKNKSYKISCEQTLVKMRKYCRDLSKLTFDDITLKWLRDLDDKMMEDGLSQNSRNIHFKNIRTCLNRAIDEELTANYPFRRFKIRAEETVKRSLTIEELREFIDADVEEYQQFYKDMFLLSFYLIGCNAVDMYSLSDITPSGRVEYRRAKTHKLYSIKAEPEAMEIIERWRGKMNLLSISERWKDYRDFTKNINIALKKIGTVQRKGRGGKKIITPRWPDLSLYWARHTWATIAYSLDIPYDTIAQSLGHKNGGPSVTATYIKIDERKVDEANRKVLDWVLYGKK